MGAQSLISEQTELTGLTETSDKSPQIAVHEVQSYVEMHLRQCLKESSDICAVNSQTHNKFGVEEVAFKSQTK